LGSHKVDADLAKWVSSAQGRFVGSARPLEQTNKRKREKADSAHARKNRSHFHISTRTPPYNPQIPITLHKEKDYDQEGREILKCGFKIGGGIDQDYKKSPQGYTDYVRRC